MKRKLPVCLLFLMFLSLGCSNDTFFNDVAIPAKQSKSGDYGLVNLNGKLVVDFEIDERPSIMIENRAHFKENGVLKFVDEKGKYYTTDFLKALHFKDGIALVRLADGRLALIDTDLKIKKILVGIEQAGYVADGLIKFKDTNGLWEIITPKYTKVFSFSEGHATVGLKDSETNSMLYGVINKTGTFVINLTDKYDLIGRFSGGLASFEEDNELGFLNTNAEKVIRSTEWEKVFPFHNGYSTVQGSDNEFGLINPKGEMIINTREKFPICLYNDLYLYVDASNKKGGFMDKDRTLMARAEFDELLPFFADGAWAKDGGRWYYVDNKGKSISKREIPEIKLLYHEEFLKNIIFNNIPFDIEETLQSEFVNIGAFCNEFLNASKEVLLLNSVSATNNLIDIQNLVNDYKEDSKKELFLTDKLNQNYKRLDTYSIVDSRLVFDKNLHFSIRLDFNKPFYDKTENGLTPNPNANLNKLRLAIYLNNKATGRGEEMVTFIKNHLEKIGYIFQEETQTYTNKGINIKLSRNYNTINIGLVPNS